jgi:hypothetical protein
MGTGAPIRFRRTVELGEGGSEMSWSWGALPGRAAMKLAALVLTGGLATFALAGCYVNVDAGPLQHRTRSYPVTGQVQTRS